MSAYSQPSREKCHLDWCLRDAEFEVFDIAGKVISRRCATHAITPSMLIAGHGVRPIADQSQQSTTP